jgi:hypothetical protein
MRPACRTIALLVFLCASVTLISSCAQTMPPPGKVIMATWEPGYIMRAVVGYLMQKVVRVSPGEGLSFTRCNT